MAVRVEEAVRVEISNDYPLISAFYEWQVDNHIGPFREGWAGRGYLVAWFPLEHKADLEEFFAGFEHTSEVDDNF